jgi:hypothetical protein
MELTAFPVAAKAARNLKEAHKHSGKEECLRFDSKKPRVAAAGEGLGLKGLADAGHRQMGTVVASRNRNPLRHASRAAG